MPKFPYPYEVNGKLVTGNGSLIPICSSSNRSLLPSLTVHRSKFKKLGFFFKSLGLSWHTYMNFIAILLLKSSNQLKLQNQIFMTSVSFSLYYRQKQFHWFKKFVKIQVSKLVIGSGEQDNVFQCLVGNLLIFVGSMSKSKSKYTYLNRNVIGLVCTYTRWDYIFLTKI